MNLNRREFMVGCSAAIAAMAGGKLGGMAFASPQDTTQRDIFVQIFLRGGVDGLTLVAPSDVSDYVDARPGLAIAQSGASAGLKLNNTLSNIDFRLHPNAAPLKELYDSNALAIIHACGLTNGTRSHFEAMDYIERGTPTNKNTATGWITRHIDTVGLSGAIPIISGNAAPPTSLMGSNKAVAMYDVGQYGLNGHWRYGDMQKQALSKFYAEDSTAVHLAGKETLDTIDLVDVNIAKDKNGNPLPYTPETGVEYPTDYYVSDFSSALRTIARVIKMDVGLQIATVDYGGWDTHEGQTWILSQLINGLSRAINAFYNDLVNYHSRLTVVIMSEFGRRLKANQSGGTDHGHGNVMFVLGGNVNGGKMHGSWPGLANEQLDNGVDLAITTDYRTVLSEILVRRLANGSLGRVFPQLASYTPMNVLKGTDVPVDLTIGGAGNRLYIPMLTR